MVYIDLLIIEDLIINYILLLGVSILLNRITKFKKIIISSIIGIIPLFIIFTKLNIYIKIFIIITFSFLMSITAFSYKDILYTIKNILYLYLISIFLAGSIYFINTNFLPQIDNYLLNTIIPIILSPIVTYIYVKSNIIIKNSNSNYYKIDIYLKDKPKITVISFLDTGNKLFDPYSQKPIILVSKKELRITNEKIILVPYNTINHHDFLKCFMPEKIYIDKIGYRKKLLIGIVDKIQMEGVSCILNSKLIERI